MHTYETVFKPRKKGGDLFSQAKRVIYGNTDYPTKVKKLLKEVGDQKIKSAKIIRTPVPSYIISLLSIVSLGDFKKKLDETEYDKLFHLAIVFDTDKGQVLIEKNEVINVSKSIPTNKEGYEEKQIQINSNPTINEILENTKRVQKDKFFKYSAYDNNCQDFIISLLEANNLGTKEDYIFVKQDTKELFETNPYLRKLADRITDTAGIFTGRGKVGGLIVKRNPFNDW